jgi:hypothetical protein
MRTRLNWRRRSAHVDPLTGLSAQPFMDLSRMIQHACENPDVGTSLREVLDVDALRRCHAAALAQQTDLRARFARLTLRTDWEPACAA